MLKQLLNVTSAAQPSSDGIRSPVRQPSRIGSAPLRSGATETADVRVLAMLLREALLGLGRLRGELEDLRRSHAQLAGEVSFASQVDSTAQIAADRARALGRGGFDAVVDDAMVYLSDNSGAAGRADGSDDFDWAEWQCATRARIRNAANLACMSTGPCEVNQGSA